MIQIEKRHLEIIKNILKEFPYHFYAFGSRVKHKSKKFSDLDICYKETIPAKILVQLEEKFEESNLPFKVELLDWNRCAEDFQLLIENDLEAIQ